MTSGGSPFPPIIFFGTEAYSCTILKTLIAANYSIAVVVTKPDAPKNRGKKITAPAIKICAESYGIPVLQPVALKQIATEIALFKQPVGVLVGFGKILPQEILDLFSHGIINVHPSLLPKYRGPSPIESAIINHDTITGVTIMRLTAAMDAGPVYAQTVLHLTGKESKIKLYQTLFDLGGRLLLQHLPHIIDGTLRPKSQNDTRATYCSLLHKSDGMLDPHHLTSEAAEARIRAYLGFPRTRIRIGKYHLIVTKAHCTRAQKTPLDIMCADNHFLSIDELIAPSGKTMSSEAFLRGYPI